MSAIASRTVPPTLPAPTAAPRPGSAVRALLTTIAVMLCLAVPLLVTAAFTPRFVEIFRDFGVALPALARFFIGLNGLLGSPLGVLACLVVIGGILIATAIISYRWSFGALAMFLLALAFFILYMALYVMAMYEPLVAMIESLQAGGKV